MLTPVAGVYWRHCALCNYQMPHDHPSTGCTRRWTWTAAMYVAMTKAKATGKRWRVRSLPMLVGRVEDGKRIVERAGVYYWPEPKEF